MLLRNGCQWRNKKRKKHVGGNPTQFKKGDSVRIQLLYGKDLGGIGYKSYKDLTWSQRVYKISHATKNAIPPKFRVHGKWYLGDRLSLSEPVDQESEKLIADRDRQQAALEKLKLKQKMLQVYEEEAKPKRGRPNQQDARRQRMLRRMNR